LAQIEEERRMDCAASEDRIVLILPAATPPKALPGAPTGPDMNVLFQLLAEVLRTGLPQRTYINKSPPQKRR
jgi:hypothetical protein